MLSGPPGSALVWSALTVMVITASAAAALVAASRTGSSTRLWAATQTLSAASQASARGLQTSRPNTPLLNPARPYPQGDMRASARAAGNFAANPSKDRGSLGARSNPAAFLGAALAGAMGFLITRFARRGPSTTPLLTVPLLGVSSVPPIMTMLSTSGATVEPSPAPAPAVKSHAAVPHELLGYELIKKEFLKEYNSEVVLYRHKKSGAEVLSMANEDENKVFGITFRTTPTDSTGLPHILEHSVLCGSRKYPVKEPFVELIKGSLNTFLNAMTYPDKTVYPVASCNVQDFYNLVDVYLDAVFYPNINPETLMQEGYHLEADDPSDPLTYKGVVFNEMKGVYSQPDALYGRLCQHNLFLDPKVTYNVDSGGDPRVIPDLTFKQYSLFHQYFYHPSNSRIFFYGDDNLEKRLTILNEYLDEFNSNSYADSRVRYQAKYPEPRRVVDSYPAADGTGLDGKTYVSVNWVLNWDRLDPVEELAVSLLNDMLLGTNASPLRRALEESGLGSSMIGGGLDTSLLQYTFSVGLKDVKDRDVDKVETLVLTTLEKIASEGFTKELIEASINSTEFAMRELNTGGFPRGIAIMLGVLQHWLHDRDPIDPLKFDQPLAALKARLAKGEDVFAPLIRSYLLDNTHRVTAVMAPDPDLGRKWELEEAERLAEIKKGMSPKEIESVIALKKQLQTKQETPDPPEALKCVPTLNVSDIDAKNKTIQTTRSSVKEATLLYNNLSTNNILYLDMVFDLHTLPQDLVPYLPLFTRALSEFGTKKEDFVSLSQRIRRKVGGLSKHVLSSSVLHKRGAEVAHLVVRGKGTVDQLPELADIITDILLEPEFNNQAKFRQMVLESKSGLEAGLVGSGHRFSGGRLSAMDNTAAFISEKMGGLSYLSFLRELLKKVDTDWPGVVATLERMRQSVVTRRNLVVNVTADEGLMKAFTPTMESLVGRLPVLESPFFKWEGALERRNEAIIIPTQVNYVSKAANIYDAGYQYHGSANVINKYLGTTWLWERVRVVGGAYGGFCGFDRLTGVYSFSSYRDPNLLSTLEAYDGTAGFVRSLDLSDDALNKAIIGAVGDYDSYQLPDAKGYSAMTRYLLNISDEDRQRTRDEILGTDRRHFRDFAEYVEAVKDKGTVVVVGSEVDVAAADAKAGGLFQTRLTPLADES
jgi:Zn-dependent M16 (insulinase) family peptidase